MGTYWRELQSSQLSVKHKVSNWPLHNFRHPHFISCAYSQFPLLKRVKRRIEMEEDDRFSSGPAKSIDLAIADIISRFIPLSRVLHVKRWALSRRSYRRQSRPLFCIWIFSYRRYRYFSFIDITRIILLVSLERRNKAKMIDMSENRVAESRRCIVVNCLTRMLRRENKRLGITSTEHGPR